MFITAFHCWVLYDNRFSWNSESKFYTYSLHFHYHSILEVYYRQTFHILLKQIWQGLLCNNKFLAVHKKGCIHIFLDQISIHQLSKAYSNISGQHTFDLLGYLKFFLWEIFLFLETSIQALRYMFYFFLLVLIRNMP